jgi:hypothetical protein
VTKFELLFRNEPETRAAGMAVPTCKQNWTDPAVAYFSQRSHGPVRSGPASKFEPRSNTRFRCLLRQTFSRLLTNKKHYIYFSKTTNMYLSLANYKSHGRSNRKGSLARAQGHQGSGIDTVRGCIGTTGGAGRVRGTAIGVLSHGSSKVQGGEAQARRS